MYVRTYLRITRVYIQTYVAEVLAQVDFCSGGNCVCVCVCVFVQRSPVEIQTPAYWKVIGQSTTAPTLVLSPNSIRRAFQNSVISVLFYSETV